MSCCKPQRRIIERILGGSPTPQAPSENAYRPSHIRSPFFTKAKIALILDVKLRFGSTLCIRLRRSGVLTIIYVSIGELRVNFDHDPQGTTTCLVPIFLFLYACSSP